MLFPQDRMVPGIGGTAPPANLAVVVHRLGLADAPAEGAEIDHPALLGPGEGTENVIADEGTKPDNLAVGVDRPGGGSGAPKVPRSTIPSFSVQEKGWKKALSARALP